ncbi:MAG TPA: hypothetical protein G4O08_13735 [Anaerolineae bacterium]|nr:hypothetical protein [Anaerolineae bacterium]
MNQQSKTLVILLLASLISLLAGCTDRPTNTEFTVRVSGDIVDLAFEGQCTAQKAELLTSDPVAQSLEVNGTIETLDQPQDFETSGFFIYCAVANQSTSGTITVELLQDGDVVTSAISTAPDEPAILEYGQAP